MDARLADIALDLALKQLQGQKEDLKNLRNQASISGALTGLIATIFASIADRKALVSSSSEYEFLGIGGLLWIILLPFAASLYFAIQVITGWQTCNFDISPKLILRMGQQKTTTETAAEIANQAENFFDGNERVLTEAQNHLWWSLMLGWVQIFGWTMLVFVGA